jgi:thioredoxin-like negative regulator of GroEL
MASRLTPWLEQLLALVQLDSEFAEQSARRAMLDVFEILGSDRFLARDYRRRLGRMLYR